MINKYTYTCFNCEKSIKTEICPHCGYSFSISDECPRKIGMKCAHTNKLCIVKNYEDCKTLRSND